MMKKLLLTTLPFFYAVFCQGQIIYPKTKKVDTIDTYFGNKVADPYRWLEDDRSKETENWVDEQIAVTNNYFDKIPFRKKIQQRLEDVFNYPKYGKPFSRAGWYYFYKNDGLQNQSVLYRQKGLNGKPELLIDPNKFSEDGTTRLTSFSVNKKGTYAIVGKSKGGSDWNTYEVMDLNNKTYLSDKIEWVKVSNPSWKDDGFFYSRYPAPDASALSQKNENHMVYFHKVGTKQNDDILVYEDKANPQRFHTGFTDEDEKYYFLNVSDRGKGFSGNAIYYCDLTQKGYKFKPIVADVSNTIYNVIDVHNNQIFILTDQGAPKYKLISVDALNPNLSKAKTIVKEGKYVIESATTGGGKIFIDYLQDVSTHTYVYNYDGKFLQEIKYPSLGDGGGLSGYKSDKELFYTFTSFTYPPTIFKYDVASGKSTVFRKPEVKFNPAQYETKQVFFPSKDKTKIPMFIVYKKGLKLNGDNPTLIYGYGGFNISLTPSFSATRIPYLDAGGVYVMVNLRGGAEYGEEWHKAGNLDKKQNVFDDCIAAAEYLIKNKYTNPNKLAVQGGSNGGLLVGAVINQRPELFKVAIPQVGVMDMLRFQKFTIGWNWIAEYGSAEKSEKEFKYLYAYSPIHNIKAQNYPATLITTADHDDRVVPAHSFKYAATLQEKNISTNPTLIRIDKNSGHGASNTKKNIELIADIYAFMFYNMGLEFK